MPAACFFALAEKISLAAFEARPIPGSGVSDEFSCRSRPLRGAFLA